MIKLALILLFIPSLFAAGVTARFDPSDPEVGPFPTDALTVADESQKTGRRVNLPLPDCEVQASACVELSLINQLDGFNLQPRIRVRFSAPVDLNTLRDGIFFLALENLTAEESGLHQKGDPIAINQVIWDPVTNTAYAKPDGPFDQHRRYALVVTDAVRDRAGDRVGADAAFQDCMRDPGQSEYCAALADAAALAAPRTVVVASVFTTLSATAWMEKARAQLRNAPLVVTRAGAKSIFRLADIATVTWRQQAGDGKFRELSLPLDNPLFGEVDRAAFGSFISPRFLNDQQAIEPLPTGADVPLPEASEEIHFQAYLPKGGKPAAGHPVVIFGHGFGDSRFGGSTIMAPTLAAEGFVTIAINVVGHGYGPESALIINEKNGASTTLPAPGRGVDLDGNGEIDAMEGCVVALPAPIAARDCLRQTVLDLAQLVRAIRAGIDLDGDGAPDLDPDRIYYAGQSLGALYGTILTALEPNVRAAALNVGGAPVVEIARWSDAYRGLVSEILGRRTPPLLAPGARFDDQYVLRDRPVKVVDAPGAIALQNYLEIVEWLQIAGDPLAFAPHLRSSTLPDVPAKPVLWQIAKGDRTVPNPASSNLIRGANMRESTWMYRHDLARAVASDLPANPHTYLALFLSADSLSVPSLRVLAIGVSAQQQIAGFFRADGASIRDPNDIVRLLFGRNLFEVPEKLPEDLNY